MIERGELAAAVVAVLLDHRDDERRDAGVAAASDRPGRRAPRGEHPRTAGRLRYSWWSNASHPFGQRRLDRGTGLDHDLVQRAGPRERRLVVVAHRQAAVATRASARCRRAGTPSARAPRAPRARPARRRGTTPTPGPSKPGVYTPRARDARAGPATSLSTRASSPARLSTNTSRPSRTNSASPPVQSPIAARIPAAPVVGHVDVGDHAETAEEPRHRVVGHRPALGPVDRARGHRVGPRHHRGDAPDELVDQREHLVALGLGGPARLQVGEHARDGRRRGRGSRRSRRRGGTAPTRRRRTRGCPRAGAPRRPRPSTRGRSSPSTRRRRSNASRASRSTAPCAATARPRR